MVKIYYDKYGRIYASWNKRNNYVDGLRWDIKKRQTNEVVEEISLNIK